MVPDLHLRYMCVCVCVCTGVCAYMCIIVVLSVSLFSTGQTDYCGATMAKTQ